MFKSLINLLKNFDDDNSFTKISSNTLKNENGNSSIQAQLESLTNEIKELKKEKNQDTYNTNKTNKPIQKASSVIEDVFANKLYSFENFLTEDECDTLIEYIDKNKVKSRTVNQNGEDEYSHYRTSSTCYINESNLSFVKNLDEKICNASNEKYYLGENIQGQHYSVGQEFKEHTDYFQGKGYEANCGEQGNRTTTFMIYLNDVEEGGATFFPRLNKRFYPKKGMALMWKNLDIYGEPDEDLRHTGEPILKGNKYIITKWFRQRAKGDIIPLVPGQSVGMNGHGSQAICSRPNSDILHTHNVLSQQECNTLISMIDELSQKSTVVVGAGKTEYSAHRTSSTAYFDENNSFIKSIDTKLSIFLGIHPDFSEGVQGQVYQVGEEFKHHHDFFHNPDGKDERFNIQGDRTWSMMVFLNHVEEGGETDFPDHNLVLTPEPGMAVYWKNTDIYGKQKFDTLHAGMPVKKGKKYIITKWYRQFPYSSPKPKNYSPEDFQRRANEMLAQQSQNILIQKAEDSKQNIQANSASEQTSTVFSNKKDLKSREDYQKVSDVPIFTEEGFKKIKIPPKTWKIIQDAYIVAKDNFKDEYDLEANDPENAGIRAHMDSDKFDVGALFSPLDDHSKEIVTNDIKEVLEQWTERSLVSTATYGFRSYNNGCKLKMHVDRIQTHVISATLCIDQKTNTPWPLDIYNHEKEESNILMEPGEMVLYESARLAHGRKQRLDGDYYVGLFVHFIPV